MKIDGFVVVVAILSVGLMILISNNNSGQTFGMDNDDFAQALVLLPFIMVLSASMLASRHNLSRNLRYAAAWLLIALVLVTGYVYRQDATTVADRVLGGLIPGRAVVTTTSDGESQVVLQRGRSGHFSAKVEIEGVTMPMMVDTGASSVVLSTEDAEKLGIDTNKLNFGVTVSTANGDALAAPTVLRQVAIGPIVRNNVRALVTQKGRMDGSLLGMSFLSTLDSVQIRGDELRLTD